MFKEISIHKIILSQKLLMKETVLSLNEKTIQHCGFPTFKLLASSVSL